MCRVMVNLLTDIVDHLLNQERMSLCDFEIFEKKKCVCVRLFNGTVQQLCSITFRLQTCVTNMTIVLRR